MTKNLANLAGVTPGKKINPKNFTKKNTDAKLFHYFQRCQSIQAQEQITNLQSSLSSLDAVEKKRQNSPNNMQIASVFGGYLILPSQNRRHLTLTGGLL